VSLNIAITGSIATDHLMRFPGKFSDSLVADKLDKVSLSFLVDDLQIRRGGVGANVAFAMGKMGLRPILVGAVGKDFSEYRSWLERHNVDCQSIHYSQEKHTARFVCTTDDVANQIASFYPGAMSESNQIELGPVLDRVGKLDFVFIGPSDPEAMLKHTQEAKQRNIAFIADPSQQMARMDGKEIAQLIDGATYLFMNEYEASLIEKKVGWNLDELMKRVETVVTTLGAKGARVQSKQETIATVACPPESARLDPTGVGDSFRAGYLAAYSWGLTQERCAQVGSMLATYVIETVGTQEYSFTNSEFIERFASFYGQDNANEIKPHLVK
jgi:adenosine kinase